MNQQHILNIAQAFVGAFITGVSVSLSSGNIQWTTSFWLAVLTAGVVSVIKYISYQWAPPVLGGKVK